MLHYSISEFNSTEQFLALVARKLGRLKKGARPDTNAAAKHVSFTATIVFVLVIKKTLLGLKRVE